MQNTWYIFNVFFPSLYISIRFITIFGWMTCWLGKAVVFSKQHQKKMWCGEFQGSIIRVTVLMWEQCTLITGNRNVFFLIKSGDPISYPMTVIWVNKQAQYAGLPFEICWDWSRTFCCLQRMGMNCRVPAPATSGPLNLGALLAWTEQGFSRFPCL